MLSSSATPDSITASLSSATPNHVSSPASTRTARSHLEQLPLEIRQKICRYVFNEHDSTVLSVVVRLHYRRNVQVLQSSTFRILHNSLLTSRQISEEVRAYFFAFYSFCLVSIHRKQGYLPLITSFWQRIGAHSLSLIRKLALPLYSIGLFGKVDCMMGQSKLWFASSVLVKFTGLTHLDLGVSVVECLPPAHAIFSTKSPTDEEVKEMGMWGWSGVEAAVPIRGCFEEAGRVIGGKEVEVGIYWSDLLTQELLPVHNRHVFERFEAIYKERLLVVLHAWLKAKATRSKGPLLGFERVYDNGPHEYILSDDSQ